MVKGTVYFFTGLAGAGKTTIGGLFYQRLKEIRPEAVLIDGDKNRDQANARAPKDYSTEARRQGAKNLLAQCNELAERGVEALLRGIQRRSPPVHELVPFQLIEGESVAQI